MTKRLDAFVQSSKTENGKAGYLVALFGVALITLLLAPFHDRLNATTVALALLLVVLFVATKWGSRPAYVASLLGMLCFNYFFLPPVGTLTIADLQNWVALFAFLVTALTVGQLSARAKRRAEEAETGRLEIERLYKELQTAFERASQAEALRRSEQLKSALLDAVTHDLRTPLTSIKASVTTLLEEKRGQTAPAGEFRLQLDEEGRQEMLEVIDEETDRLNHFIEGLVELARIEAGEIHLRRRWVAVEDILTLALTRAASLTSQHHIAVDLERELPLVRLDAQSVAEVLFLLLDNAAKYSPPGSAIRVQARLAAGEMVQLSVTDEGVGLPAHLRERVFEKFFRATPDYAAALRRPTGMGMGLAIARGIIEAHGGRIWIEDPPAGRGLCVTFTLPIGDDEPVVTAPPPAPASSMSDRIEAGMSYE